MQRGNNHTQDPMAHCYNYSNFDDGLYVLAKSDNAINKIKLGFIIKEYADPDYTIRVYTRFFNLH